MEKNDQAQWLLLSALVVSFGIIALLLLLNTAVLVGHSSIESVMDFPKNQIRDLRNVSIAEAIIIGGEVSANTNDESDRMLYFDDNYTRYVNEMASIYERHGAIVDIKCTPYVNGSVVEGLVEVFYNDGNTIYMLNQTVNLW
jgi:hypothetical protein